jgi:hypothetical protein
VELLAGPGHKKVSEQGLGLIEATGGRNLVENKIGLDRCFKEVNNPRSQWWRSKYLKPPPHLKQ